MSKFTEKYQKLISATDRLKEAIADYETTPLDSVRDGQYSVLNFAPSLRGKP